MYRLPNNVKTANELDVPPKLLARADSNEAAGAPLLASQEENEWPREDHTNPFAQPERTGIVRMHQKSQHQPGAKVEPDRRTTAPDSRAHAVRRRHRPRRPALAKIRPDEIFRERQLAIYRDFRPRPLAPKIFGLWAASSSLTRRRSATSRRNREISRWSSAVRSSLRLGSSALRHRCKVMTLTPSVRAISLCGFPCLAKSFACASFVATSTLEYRFNLAIAACPQPPRASVLQHKGQLLFFGQTDVGAQHNGTECTDCGIGGEGETGAFKCLTPSTLKPRPRRGALSLRAARHSCGSGQALSSEGGLH